MLAKGMRQIRLAALLEIGRDSMSAYANGKTIPHGARLEQICKILECKLGDLVPAYGTDIPSAEEVRPYTIMSEKDGTVWLTVNHAVAKMASFEEAAAIIVKLGLAAP